MLNVESTMAAGLSELSVLSVAFFFFFLGGRVFDIGACVFCIRKMLKLVRIQNSMFDF